MTDEFDVLKNQAEWRKAKKAAQDDMPDTMATTLIIMKRVGRRVVAVDGKIEAVNKKLVKHVKTDDRRHDLAVGMIADHIGQPASVGHPNTEACSDGVHCGGEEPKEPNALVRLLTNKAFLKVLSGVLTIVVLVLAGSAYNGGL